MAGEAMHLVEAGGPFHTVCGRPVEAQRGDRWSYEPNWVPYDEWTGPLVPLGVITCPDCRALLDEEASA